MIRPGCLSQKYQEIVITLSNDMEFLESHPCLLSTCFFARRSQDSTPKGGRSFHPAISPYQLAKGRWLETDQLLEVPKLSWLLAIWQTALLRCVISMEVKASHIYFRITWVTLITRDAFREKLVKQRAKFLIICWQQSYNTEIWKNK